MLCIETGYPPIFKTFWKVFEVTLGFVISNSNTRLMSILIITPTLDMNAYWYENELLPNWNFYVSHMESVVWNTKISCTSLTENFLFMLHDYSFRQHSYLSCYANCTHNTERKEKSQQNYLEYFFLQKGFQHLCLLRLDVTIEIMKSK